MNRAQARRTWEAARDAGCKPLSWRLYDALINASKKGGTHVSNSGGAAFDLQRKGLVTIAYPFATATGAGAAMLRQIREASLPCCQVCAKPGPKLCAYCASQESEPDRRISDAD